MVEKENKIIGYEAFISSCWGIIGILPNKYKQLKIQPLDARKYRLTIEKQSKPPAWGAMNFQNGKTNWLKAYQAQLRM